MARYLFLTVFSILMIGCNAEHTQENATEKAEESFDKKIQQVYWIQGDWYKEYPTGMLNESWARASDTELVGHSSLISKEGDTMMTENIRLVSDGQVLWYIPTVSNQNDGRPVRFKETILTDTMVTFENLEHDYPQRIIYRRTSDSTIEASIEGVVTNRTSRETFSYKKK